MIHRLKVKNFKSVGKKGVDLSLKPLTILVGPNGSGKSSILEALALLAQSIDSSLQLKGNLTAFESPNEIAYKGKLDTWISIEVHEKEGAGLRYAFRLDTEEAEITAISAGRDQITARLIGDRRTGFKLEWELPDGERHRSEKRSDFLPISRYAFRDGKPEFEDKAKIIEHLLAQLKNKVYFLSAERGEVPRTTGITGQVNWVGRKGENLITLLSIASSPYYKEPWKKITKWASRFGLMDLWAGPSTSGGGLTSQYIDPVLGNPVNLSLAGNGSRQIANVIVQIFWSSPGSIVLIEEPELSLHPQSMLELCKLFGDATQEDKQIIITTHTSFVLLSLSKAVADHTISAENVSVYEVNKSGEGTTAKPLNVNKSGYIEGWVKSFAEAEKQLLSDWVKTLPEAEG